MLKIIILMLLIFSNSANASDLERASKSLQESMKVGEYLLSFDKDANYRKYFKTKQCKKQHDYVDRKVQNDPMMAELLHASIAEDCDKDIKMLTTYYSKAAENGSVIGQEKFEELSSMMDIDSLKVDIGSLQGQKIGVKGIGQYIMDVFMLKKDVMDTNPILVDISQLKRRQRLEIIQKCSNIIPGCNVTVFGTVVEVNYKNGILAEKIVW